MDKREHTAIGNAAFVLTLRERGVRDTAVLRAMEQVPREHFAPVPLRAHARRDIALPLPCGQSMTAPTKIAAMLAALAVPKGARVLEIGTGSGFVTALLRQLGVAEIRSLERYATLAEDARASLAALGAEVPVEICDGLDRTKFAHDTCDRILINATCSEVPLHLREALRPGGRLVCAVETSSMGPNLFILARDVQGDFREELGQPLRLPALTLGRARVL